MPTPKPLRVHVGLNEDKLANLMKGEAGSAASKTLINFAATLGLTDPNVKQIRFGIISGDIAVSKLEALKSADGVKWVEEDQTRHILPEKSKAPQRSAPVRVVERAVQKTVRRKK